jgi:hypothetical protein
MTDDKKSEAKIGDFIKKAVTTGIGAAFMTEEMLRDKLGDLSLSKDALNNIVASTKNARDELYKSVKSEVKKLIGSVNVSEEIQKIAENYDIEVKATFSFHPKKKK